MPMASARFRSAALGKPCWELGTAMIANRNARASWTGRRSERPDGDTPYELVAVCMWSVLGVALVALVLWLALGGTI